MHTAYDLIWMVGERTPDQLALVDDVSERQYTYRELLEEVDAIAAGLYERGVRQGTRMATVLPNSLEHCLSLLALQRLGVVPALINFRLKGEEIAELIEVGEIKGAVIPNVADLAQKILSVVPGSVLLSVGGSAAPATPWSECRGDVAQLPPRFSPKPEDPVFLFYTSGTTGLPKAVVLTHRTSEPRIVWLSTLMGLRAGGHIRALGVSPLSHAIGFYGIFLVTLAYGGTYYVLSAFNPEAAVNLIERHRINFLFSLPTVFSALVSTPSYDPKKMASVEMTLWGGATMGADLVEKLLSEWPGAKGHIYGTTETMCPLYNPSPAGNHDTLFPAYGSRVRIVKLNGGPDDHADPGEQGELLIDAETDVVFSSYLNRPDATAEKIRGGWYFSGDAAVLDSNGGIRLAGRVDDMIRSGGEFVQPAEVEAVLGSHPGVGESAVIGVSDPHWTQIVVACIVAKDPTLAVEELDRHCRASTLADFKRPRGYVFVDALPMGAGNKLLRRVLRDTAEGARDNRGDVPFHAVSGR